MPSFSVECDVDFEAFCGSCGTGMCHNVNTGKTPRRGKDCINIDPCEDCLEKAKQEAKEKAEAEYQSRIDDLEAELEALKEGNPQ